jgi:transposase
VDGFGRWRGDLRWEQSLDSASPAEVTRLEKTLDTVAVGRPGKPGRPRKRPKRLIAERGYDSNPLRARRARRGIEPIIPARSHHKRATHQDGRKLRRYRRRWIVERTFSWLGHFRRLVVRDERLMTVYAGFLHRACALLTLRKVLK